MQLKNFNHFVVLICCIHLLYRVDAKQIVKAPNIIVLMADDLGWNDVSFHGSNQIPTPNIDAIAYNGVILHNHYALPSCTPSRTAFLTGRYPIRAGMQGFPLKTGEPRGVPLDTPLLAEFLRKLGYTTRLVGKWHIGYHTEDFTPARRGFDTFYGFYNGFITYFNHTVTSYSGYTGYDMHRDTSAELKVDWSRRKQYATDVFTDEAVDIIKHHDDKHPLYLHVSHLAPHSSDAEDTLETRNLAKVNKTFGYISDIERRKYTGMVSAMDESVGRIVEALGKKNILQNSVVIFLSDNGAKTVGLRYNKGSNYPLRGLKLMVYEGAVRSVACVYSPLISNPGRIVKDLIHITDWLPTLYAVAGGDIADLGEIDGIDQWPMISRGEPGKRKSLLVNIDEVKRTEAAIVGQYKLVKGESPPNDGYFGDNAYDGDPSAPAYDVKAVITSPVSRTIAKITKNLTTSTKVLQLREQSTIICKAFTEFANCFEHCLFDLDVDPCETTDISEERPELMEKIEDFLNYYQTVLVDQTNAPVDPNSYPQYHNGTWVPWIYPQWKNKSSTFVISYLLLPVFFAVNVFLLLSVDIFGHSSCIYF